MTLMIERSLPALPVELLESTDLIPLLPPIKAANCLKQLRRLDGLFNAELDLLKKIRYKQKNQHGSATWWRHLTGAQRVAVRFNEELKTNLLIYFDEAKGDAKPTTRRATLERQLESCLRLLLLQDHSHSFNVKALAALEQQLRAALFMPLTLTCKAIVARLETLYNLFKAELDIYLQVIAESCKKLPDLRSQLDTVVQNLPQELQKYWKAHEASSKVSMSATPCQAPSAAPSRMPSPDWRLQSPAMPVAQAASSVEVPSKRAIEAPHADIEKQSMSKLISEAAVAIAEPPAKRPKSKKRKKTAAPKDDIDAIFGKL